MGLFFYNKKAQASMGEYGITISIVLAVIMGMSVFIRRSIQARIYGARNTMTDIVVDRTAGLNVGGIYYSYEPYYEDTVTTSDFRTSGTHTLSHGGLTGSFRKDVYQRAVVAKETYTAPPNMVD